MFAVQKCGIMQEKLGENSSEKRGPVLDVYECCPKFENESFLLRPVMEEDCNALLKVYSDPQAVPLFNSDNCGGDTFYYTTGARMAQAISYWRLEYGRRGFVRWAVVNLREGEAVGTIELFHRDAMDAFTDCGILRLDLRSDCERAQTIESILSLILPAAFSLFACGTVATKASPAARERICALENLGFVPSNDVLIGHDGTAYGDYYVLYSDSHQKKNF